MMSFLFLSPQIQDGDHHVKLPTPFRKSLTCHNYHVVETFFQSHGSRHIDILSMLSDLLKKRKYEVTISLLSLKCIFFLNPWSLALI